MKKALIKIIILLSFIFAMVFSFSACDKTEWFNITYSANTGGIVMGELNQKIEKGSDAKTVTAIENTGYIFIKWSDGLTSATRQDKNVKTVITVTAEFEKITNDIIYSVNAGGWIKGEISQSIAYGDDAEAVTAVENTGYIFIKWSDGLTSATRQDKNIISVLNFSAIFEKISIDLYYSAGTGGNISGKTSQTVEYGDNAGIITATPNTGYKFLRWSDGLMTETRQDKNVTDAITVTAEFEQIINSANYSAGTRGSINGDASQSVVYGGNAASITAVPYTGYKFVRWSDGLTSATRQDKSVTDIINVTAEFERRTDIDIVYFPILMVFVTEIDTTLYRRDGTAVKIDYKMSDVERQICDLIAIQFSAYLNEWFDGLVAFEIDGYFTNVVLGSDSFSIGLYNNEYNYSIDAYNILEVSTFIKNYRSVITTFNMEDYNGLLHNISGSGSDKYAALYLESIFLSNIINNEPIENWLDLKNPNWESTVYLYLHEFTHTVEYAARENYNVSEYHDARSRYIDEAIKNTGTYSTATHLELTRLYLLNNLFISDEKLTGITYEFWKGEILVAANYVTNVIDGWCGGRIVIFGDTTEYVQGNNSLYKKVQFGSDLTVEALAFEGYRFVEWSDGVTTVIRYDTNIISLLTIMAIFEKI